MEKVKKNIVSTMSKCMKNSNHKAKVLFGGTLVTR
jgi:hypothetical protein